MGEFKTKNGTKKRRTGMNPYINESNLTREIYPLPDDIHVLLKNYDVLEAYKRRPDFQKNDYIGWIGRAKRKETREKRINQMLTELKEGNKYMNMDYTEK
ncbi:hypothetical protein MCOL2_11030 [Listeria fleischmannii FSL S10-1203]|uniref:Bacteriocin-protection, YdeI or OmpD-Associated n=1 Tax=Listeria fleischmannii FSL S10-1203 TaxID=1265822 RepID=W7DMI2_9LIST|nr:hypothetical protein MCOL2_11030 [Listeria fleischmannii FSL S10-1203]